MRRARGWMSRRGVEVPLTGKLILGIDEPYRPARTPLPWPPETVRVPMRQDCKNFESRTYPNGETVRKCNLDLAPEAPWRCPTTAPSSSAGSPTSTGATARW